MDKIDFVILWVDSSDPEWQRQRERFSAPEDNNGTDENRFRDWGLLRYWFRGVEQYAPWVHRVFLVTNGQVPDWLNRDHPKLRLVRHEEYIPMEFLPTFNSNVIELWLHQIQDLGERFVLFNDDMYLTAPVEPKDFFRGGLPCESAVMDAVTAPGPEDCMPHMVINNFALINRYFNKKKVLRENRGKFFTPRYGSGWVRNLLLSPFQYFSAFRDSHLPTSYLKETFFRVWEIEKERLYECGNHRFRSKSDVTHWLFKCWQICEGNFSVRSTRWGHYFELGEADLNTICRSLKRQKYHAVCLNDSKADIAFDTMRNQLAECFETIFPDVSEYEKL